MKRTILTLLVGILIGFSVAILALPALEEWREKKIVREAIHDFGLPALPPGTKVIYAYHKNSFIIEQYGFELLMTPEETKKWEAEARSELLHGLIEIDCKVKDSRSVEVKITEIHK